MGTMSIVQKTTTLNSSTGRRPLTFSVIIFGPTSEEVGDRITPGNPCQLRFTSQTDPKRRTSGIVTLDC